MKSTSCSVTIHSRIRESSTRGPSPSFGLTRYQWPSTIAAKTPPVAADKHHQLQEERHSPDESRRAPAGRPCRERRSTGCDADNPEDGRTAAAPDDDTPRDGIDGEQEKAQPANLFEDGIRGRAGGPRCGVAERAVGHPGEGRECGGAERRKGQVAARRLGAGAGDDDAASDRSRGRSARPS